jgi:hypothetical protein
MEMKMEYCGLMVGMDDGVPLERETSHERKRSK